MTNNLHPKDEISLAINSIPFVRALGPKLIVATEKLCHLQLDCAKAFRQSPDSTDLSPGLIAGILDQIGSCTLTAAIGKPISKATLSMSLSFAQHLHTDESIDFYGEAKLVSNTLGSSALTACDNKGQPIVHGLVSYMIGSYPGTSGEVAPRDHNITHANDNLNPAPVSADCFDEWLGVDFSTEKATVKFSTHLMGSIEPVRAFHGGAVAAVMISEALCHAGELGAFQLSHFTLEYLRAAKDDDLQLHSKVVRRSRRTLVLQCDVFQDSGSRHVATATCRLIDYQS